MTSPGERWAVEVADRARHMAVLAGSVGNFSDARYLAGVADVLGLVTGERTYDEVTRQLAGICKVADQNHHRTPPQR